MLNPHIVDFVNAALAEDIGRGDLFAPLAPKGEFGAKIVSKSDGVLSGMAYVETLCNLHEIECSSLKKDGNTLTKGETILTLKSTSATLLSAERTILDILQHSSGIATNVSRYVKALGENTIKILDTRKTRPLLREFEKYSVLNGGGVNHRKGLDDALMLKDTHLKTVENLQAFMKTARASIPWTSKIEIECEAYAQAVEAMEAGADIIMCDNMEMAEIQKVATYRRAQYPHILIEISGNITVENIANYLNLDIDAISSGSMIHQATWLDFSMRVE